MMKFSDKQMLMIIGAVFVLIYMAKQAVTSGAEAVARAVDITSKENVASQLADKTTAALTGGQDKSLGGYWQRKCAEKNYEPWYCPNVLN